MPTKIEDEKLAEMWADSQVALGRAREMVEYLRLLWNRERLLHASPDHRETLRPAFRSPSRMGST